MKQKTLLTLLCFILLVGNMIFLTSVLLTRAPITGRAQNNGIASFCINTPPLLNVPCNSTLSQGQPYFCQLNYTDDQGNNVTFTTNTVFFNMTQSGVINFTPNNSEVGNHTALFTGIDDSGCPNNQTNASFNFSIANINDPPYLVKPLPDKTFQVNTSVSAFFLSDFFSDPDIPYGDFLNFSATIPAHVTMTVLPTSEVIFSSQTCGFTDLVTFTANENDGPFSVDSNTVSITVTCQQPSGGTTSGGKTSGGGAGGGGAAECRPNWECDDWLACLPTNIQWRRCYDKAGCKGEDFLKRSCVYGGQQPACTENWLCKDWGQCLLNGTQYRTCQDLKACGTTQVKPPTVQSCTYKPSCNDGIQNGDETSVDCGGSCAACQLIQSPKPVSGPASWLLLLIILGVLFTSGVVHYYRAQLAQGVATLGFLIRHKAYKEILLDVQQRKSFFERILAFEQLVESQKEKPSVVYDTLATLVRQYIADALMLHPESIVEEVRAQCRKLGLRQETTTIITALFAKLEIIEQSELELDEYFVLATAEELRTLVCLTSDYKTDELLRQVEDIPITDKMSFYDEIFCRTMNALRALQFNQVDAAKKEYMTILTRYDPLSESEKEQIYPELQWTFQVVKFQSEITGARVVRKPANA